MAFRRPLSNLRDPITVTPIDDILHYDDGDGTGLRICIPGTSGAYYHLEYLCPVIIITSRVRVKLLGNRLSVVNAVWEH